jgi:ABC-type arginine transport system ATPase subunit
MECVPNFSEGRDLEKIEKIVDKFRAKAGVKLLDYSNDEDHNRLVVTVVGEPEALKDALLEAIGQAVELIDLTKHSGQHPRMGAVDVVPFIPIRGCTMDEAIALSKEVGEVLELMKQLANDGMTMVVVTHEMGFAREVASRVLFMADGKILEQNKPSEFFAHPENQRLKDFLSKII